MDFSVVYLAQRLLYRFLDFFHHWYVDGSRAFGRKFMELLRGLDQSFAVGITIRHFFEPLYKDYTLIGRILGFVFRALRVILGGLFYILFAVAFAIVYIMWLLVPAIFLFYAARTI